METTFTLTVPPSVNHIYHLGCRGGRVNVRVSDEYASWQQIVVAEMFNQAVPKYAIPPTKVEFIIHYHFEYVRSDLDNYNKALLDAVAKRMGFNDSRVYHIDAWKHVDKKFPRVEVTVRDMETPCRKKRGKTRVPSALPSK